VVVAKVVVEHTLRVLPHWLEPLPVAAAVAEKTTVEREDTVGEEERQPGKVADMVPAAVDRPVAVATLRAAVRTALRALERRPYQGMARLELWHLQV